MNEESSKRERGRRGEKVRKGEKIFSPSYAHACEHEKRE